jgi:hypothetical protein
MRESQAIDSKNIDDETSKSRKRVYYERDLNICVPYMSYKCHISLFLGHDNPLFAFSSGGNFSNSDLTI